MRNTLRELGLRLWRIPEFILLRAVLGLVAGLGLLYGANVAGTGMLFWCLASKQWGLGLFLGLLGMYANYRVLRWGFLKWKEAPWYGTMACLVLLLVLLGSGIANGNAITSVAGTAGGTVSGIANGIVNPNEVGLLVPSGTASAS